MPKRKRTHRMSEEVDPAQDTKLKKEQLERKLVHGKKVLNRALKTAKGFERQKLSKRIKLATTQLDGREAGRLRKELNALKNLDLSVAVESHLGKSLLRSKSIHESGLLPEYIKIEKSPSQGLQEDISAVSNVTARLYNTKQVKEAMSYIMGSVFSILGIENPHATTKRKIVERNVPGLEGGESTRPAEYGVGEDVDESERPSTNQHQSAWDNSMHLASPNAESNHKSDTETDNGQNLGGTRIRLVGGSSDEEIDGDVTREIAVGHPTPDLGIQEQPEDTSASISDHSQSSSSLHRPKKPNKQAQQRSSKPGSTFLPTLMGGYWSGSESATDDEELSTRKKNRPGQQARRALWEKKFGARANHLKGPASGKSRDRDWDPRRDARAAGDGRFTQGRASSRALVKEREKSTIENVSAVKPRARGMGKKDDAGPLHPSWEAAKKAKEAKQTASFQGKKVVFE